MMRLAPILLLLAVVTVSFSAQAQSDIIIKQKAKQLPGANNPPPPARPGASGMPATPAAPAAPALTPEKQAQFDKLTADLAAIKAGSEVTAEQKQALETDLLTLANTGAKPSKAALAKLAADLAAALAGKTVTARDHSQLVRALNVVVNSGNLSAAQTQTYLGNAQTALKASGVADADLQAVTADLKAVAAELQKNKPGLYR